MRTRRRYFENYCDWLNYFDSSISVQLTFINRRANNPRVSAIHRHSDRDDDYNSIRREYAGMLKNHLHRATTVW
jgi:hypothetical protein